MVVSLQCGTRAKQSCKFETVNVVRIEAVTVATNKYVCQYCGNTDASKRNIPLDSMRRIVPTISTENSQDSGINRGKILHDVTRMMSHIITIIHNKTKPIRTHLYQHLNEDAVF
jgi:alpha-tubulin suppressor-like RCC1 family protein